MGEYATRKSDNEHIKIGTCESMYYLRFDDIDHVIYDYDLRDTEANTSFRIPFPDEDHLLPGAGCLTYNRGYRLRAYIDSNTDQRVDFDSAPYAEHPGNLQLTHPCGLLLNVSCYHGHRLPEAHGGFRPFWNGKDPAFFELVRVKLTPDGLLPLVQCHHCTALFRSDWASVLMHIANQELRDRLTAYAIWRPGDALPDSRAI